MEREDFEEEEEEKRSSFLPLYSLELKLLMSEPLTRRGKVLGELALKEGLAESTSRTESGPVEAIDLEPKSNKEGNSRSML